MSSWRVCILLLCCISPSLQLDYLLAESGAKVCPAGLRSPRDASACQAAASELGLVYSSSYSTAFYPKGCYQFLGGGANANKVLFNTHEVGEAHASAAPVCHTAYYFEAENVATCSAGLAALTDASDCQNAAAALGQDFETSNNYMYYPAGCYQFTAAGANANKLFFNTHSTGSAHAQARMVCRDAFYRTAAGNAECPLGKGLAEVDSGASCSVAADALGLTWSMANSYEFYPKGCYVFSGIGANMNRVFFNRHASGSAHSFAGVVCRTAYELAAPGAEGCAVAEGLEALQSVGACQAAAAAMGLTWEMSNSYVFYPSGCYQFIAAGSTQNKLFFNTYTSGPAHGSARPVCLRQTIPTTRTSTTEPTFVGSAALSARCLAPFALALILGIAASAPV